MAGCNGIAMKIADTCSRQSWETCHALICQAFVEQGLHINHMKRRCTKYSKYVNFFHDLSK